MPRRPSEGRAKTTVVASPPPRAKHNRDTRHNGGEALLPRRNGISHLTQPPPRPRPSASPQQKQTTAKDAPARAVSLAALRLEVQWKIARKISAASSRKQARAHRQRRPWRGRADAEAAVCRMEGRMMPRHGRIPRGGRPMAIPWEARGARPTAARTSGERPTVMLGRGGDDSRTRVTHPRGRARCRGAREGRNKPPHNRKGGRPTDNTTLATRRKKTHLPPSTPPRAQPGAGRIAAKDCGGLCSGWE